MSNHWNYYSLLILIIHLIEGFAKVLNLNELRHYEIVEPSHVGLHGRKRRDLSTFLPNENKHIDETTFEFSGHKRYFLLHVYKNDFLIADGFLSIYQNSDASYHYDKSVPDCYYHGYLGGRERSSAALSTCYGLNGVIKDEDGEEFVIEPHPDENNNKYILYKSSDVVMIANEKQTCGVKHGRSSRRPLSSSRNNHTHSLHRYFDTGNDMYAEVDETLSSESMMSPQNISEHKRTRRGTTDMKYIEATIIMDNLKFKEHKTVNATQHRGLSILNFVDSYYKIINTRVVVAYLIVWNINDLATVTKSASETLDNIEDYSKNVLRGEMKLHFDNTQLITGQHWGGLAGLAGVGVICTQISSAVNRDHSPGAHTSANTVAHEMGHNIGFMHVGGNCKCLKPPCTMDHTASTNAVQSFAECTVTEYKKRLYSGDLPCLFNYPRKFFDDPKCGNGLLEQGEDCDCGSKSECEATDAVKCCDFATCKLKSTAQCAQGPCCNDCMFKKKGALCRQKMNRECDLEEFCTGTSHNCPDNFYVQDGQSCRSDTAYCYGGSCKTHDTQCQMLWGPSAIKAEDVCFNVNVRENSTWGSCGKNERDEWIRCAQGDQLCGKLQCRAKSVDVKLPTFPIIGTGRSRKTVVYWDAGKTVTCILGKTNVSPDLDDPTITGPGIKCADNSICLNHKCTNITSMTHIKKCKKTCLNSGVCNNEGNCHCAKGYAPPYCELSGPGGSIDSGGGGIITGDDCDGCFTTVAKGMLILFLLVIPVFALTISLLYHNRHSLCGSESTKVTDNVDSHSVEKGIHSKEMNDKLIGGVENPHISYNQGHPVLMEKLPPSTYGHSLPTQPPARPSQPPRPLPPLLYTANPPYTNVPPQQQHIANTYTANTLPQHPHVANPSDTTEDVLTKHPSYTTNLPYNANGPY